MYAEITIKPADSGFGEYEVEANAPSGADEYEDRNDLLDAIRDNVDEMYILGEDELPEDVEDIRGLIHNEPSTVIAFRDGDYTGYTGISEER